MINVIKRHLGTKVFELVQKGISIGIEHEFFLMSKDGSPANLGESQEFFRKLENEKFKAEKTKCGLFKGVVKNNPDGTWDSIKYEYPPHLIEISTSPKFNLIEQDHNIGELLDLVATAAHKANLNVLHKHYIANPPMIDLKTLEKTESVHAKIIDSRKKISESKGELDRMIYNFPERVASTQIHVGGIDWVTNKDYLKNLLKTEPAAYAIVSQDIIKNSHIDERWVGYLKLFGDDPLFGFSTSNLYETDQWVNYFSSKMPKANTAENFLKGYSSVRDLRFIKPKPFGTLEFRSAPAQDTRSSIMKCAAIRLAQALITIDKNFQLSHNPKLDWENYINQKDNLKSQIEELKKLSREVLLHRDFNEESLL